MRMIPSSPCGTDSAAERVLFDRLREAFARPGPDSPVAFHSLRLARHPRKRFCEIDFLLCGAQGIFVLEVKGGGISCHEGRWASTDRAGVRHALRESPFRQAESALHALIGRVRQSLPGIAESFTIGYGTVFPDCRFEVPGAEWERPIAADMRDLRDMDRWLKGFFRFWRDRDQGRRPPTTEDIGRLIHFLRPEFDVSEPLFRMVADVESRIATLTDDQLRVLDIIDANPRVLCEGGAGTGKTFLAVELARRWAHAGARVAVVCRSPWLRRYLESCFVAPGLTVTEVDGIEAAMRRAGMARFDALIVDEGQDLFDLRSLDRLDTVVEGGLECGRWCLFHDSNNQAGLFGTPDPDASELLRSTGATKVPLRTNCRNTRVILERVKRDLGADMGVHGAGHGPPVREHFARSQPEAAHILASELHELTDAGGLAAGAITILSPYPFALSSASLLPPQLGSRIAVLDEFSLRSFPPDRTSFAEITAFKGLENEAVILTDLPATPATARDLTLHYVGMSRPRAVLSIIRSSPAPEPESASS